MKTVSKDHMPRLNEEFTYKMSEDLESNGDQNVARDQNTDLMLVVHILSSALVCLEEVHNEENKHSSIDQDVGDHIERHHAFAKSGLV
jgi:hypothetical protein